MATSSEVAPWLRQFFQQRNRSRLSPGALETLAIVAYRQPITRPEIEDIRGVDCGGTLRVLLERNLIRVVGKKEEPGRPALYGTTRGFLDFFNLRDLKELPTLRQFTELSEEHQRQVEMQYGGGPPTILERIAEAEEGPPLPPHLQAEASAAAASQATDTSGLHNVYSDTQLVDQLRLQEEEDERSLEALDQALLRADEVLLRAES